MLQDTSFTELQQLQEDTPLRSEALLFIEVEECLPEAKENLGSRWIQL